MRAKLNWMFCLCLYLSVSILLTIACKKEDVKYDEVPVSKITYTVHSDGSDYYFRDTTFSFITNPPGDINVNFFKTTRNGQAQVGLVVFNYGYFGLPCRYWGTFYIPVSTLAVGTFTYSGAALASNEDLGSYVNVLFDGNNSKVGYIGSNPSDYTKITITKRYSLLHHVPPFADTPSIYVNGTFDCLYTHLLSDPLNPNKFISLKGSFTDMLVRND